MSADLFAAAATEDVVPASSWTRPEGADEFWSEFDGPHPTWDDFLACTQPYEDVTVHPFKDGHRARVCLALDRTTGLWIFGIDADGPVSSSGSPPGYATGGYKSREEALAVGREKSLARMSEHATTARDYYRREREQAAASRTRQENLEANPSPRQDARLRPILARKRPASEAPAPPGAGDLDARA